MIIRLEQKLIKLNLVNFNYKNRAVSNLDVKIDFKIEL